MPEPTGEKVGHGMRAVELAAGSALEPWEPSALYPALPTPSVGRSVAADALPRGKTSIYATSSNDDTRLNTPASGAVVATAWLWFQAYQGTLSRVDGATCRFHPTCSRFAIDAISATGPWGGLLTFARLQRAHTVERHYAMSDPPFLDDPLDNYVFWLRPSKLDAAEDSKYPSHAWFHHVRAARRIAPATQSARP